MTSVAAAVMILPEVLSRAPWACTVCDSDTGQQVRTAIFNESFWPTLAAVAAPFPILLLGLAVYQFGLPCAGKRA